MPEFRTISGEDVPNSNTPPRDDQSGHTIKDVVWHIQQHIDKDWHVEKAGFRQPARVKRICLLIRLVRESGSTVDCLPLNPWEYNPGPKVYRAHRIVASGDHDKLPAVITPRKDLGQYTDDTRFGHFPAPQSLSEEAETNPDSLLRFHNREKIVDIDRQIRENGGKHGRGYTVKDENEAKLCLLLVARWVTSVYGAQESFEALVAKPKELGD